MKKRVLLIATVQCHICQFHRPLAKILHDAGYEVDVAARNNLAEKNGLSLDFADRVFDIPFERSPYKLGNIKAMRMLKKILKENHYDYIHCNTPVGGVIGRLCAKKYRKSGTKVFYTAHGFHFYKGAPLKNWILFYPIEKHLAKVTDKLITIVHEDYNLSKEKFKTKTFYIHGVGVDPSRFHPIDEEEKKEKRTKLELPLDKKIVLCVGELNKNKDQITVIKAIEKVIQTRRDILLLLAGNGKNDSKLKEYVETHGLSEYVKFLGYNPHIEEYTKTCDVIVSASIREGLGLNIIEGMLCQKLIFASFNRGHNDLLEEDENFQFKIKDSEKLASFIIDSYDENNSIALEKIKYNYEKAKLFTFSEVEKELENIYFESEKKEQE